MEAEVTIVTIVQGTGLERGENLGSEETEIILIKNSSDKLSLITSAFPI